jgi:hypothetical protein
MPAPVSVKPCREHTGIVHDQQVVGPKQLREFAEHTILLGGCPPIQMQHPRGRSVGQRVLCDSFGWQVVMEIGNQHRKIIEFRSSAAVTALLCTFDLTKQKILRFLLEGWL